ncbi:GNAT family N-acetyltransferase [Fodinibius sediminis]|uniref:Putative acetyltransferase n=1 Tax=Fodinibius sediminis TaxID=1214077 RepID=A0A521EKJ0_9BACT|nr:N-acetyltransferase [Fodinibius sediminis]SMO84428.1 putative acetyltransferase [Fodinibius sediminis]
MNYAVFDTGQSREVIELFRRVFTDSEGRDEGMLIGNLVSGLISTRGRDVAGFVATDQEKIVGCIFFSRLTVQDNTNAFILSPVAVDTSYQGQGTGQELIGFGIQHLKEQGVERVFTYGNPAFYGKVGFKPVSEECVSPPLELTQPEGWLGQSLTGDKIMPIAGASRCVEALNKQEYW